MGDWLRDPGPGWFPGYGAPAQAPHGFAPHAAAHGPWIPPPSLDAEEPRSRWSAGALAPWVVAGLLCALLLTGREAPTAPPAEATPVELGSPVAATVAPACPGVAP